ncbi:MAG: hypothetical protein Q8N51_01235 [Gammaproteobacteria bacterium]|nr:hypothetical protein [Gammaproteobacteria bacterium]
MRLGAIVMTVRNLDAKVTGKAERKHLAKGTSGEVIGRKLGVWGVVYWVQIDETVYSLDIEDITAQTEGKAGGAGGPPGASPRERIETRRLLL